METINVTQNFKQVVTTLELTVMTEGGGCKIIIAA
jgi:hypothetical protein